MNEAFLNLFGVGIGGEQGLDFSLRVMDFINVRLSERQAQTGELFNLEATPAEGASYRLAMLDKEHYSDTACAKEEAYRKQWNEGKRTEFSMRKRFKLPSEFPVGDDPVPQNEAPILKMGTA